MSRRIARLVVLVAALLPGGAAPGMGSPGSGSGPAAFRRVPELEAGFRLLYEQRFPEARESFTRWAAENPGDPLGETAVAASYLFEEFYRQGVMTSDFFLDDRRFLNGIDGEPDPGRMRGFREALGKAREAAERRLRKDGADPEALYALTLGSGMESNALSILEKRQLAALGRIREAQSTAGRLLAVRPDAADAWLALGSANYIIGSLPRTTRFFLWFGGFHGDRELGMEQLGKTAADGRYLRPFAKILLALAARREERDDLAERLLRELTGEFPASPLFAAEHARVAGAAAPLRETLVRP